MAYNLGSVILHPNAAKHLRLSQNSNKHHHLFILSPGHQFHTSAATTLGVILCGPRFSSHVVLIECENDVTINFDSKGLSDTIYACETNKLIGVAKGFKIIKSKTYDDFDILLGITQDTSFIGMKHENHENTVHCTDKGDKLTSDLLEIANLQERPKRKKKCLEKVTVKGTILKPRVAHQAAYAWIKDNAKDDVIIDFVPSNSNSMIRRFQIRNGNGDFVIVRTLRECLDKVQQKIGRNFYKELEKGEWEYVKEEEIEKETEEEKDDKDDVNMKKKDAYNSYLFGSDSDNTSGDKNEKEDEKEDDE